MRSPRAGCAVRARHGRARAAQYGGDFPGRAMHEIACRDADAAARSVQGSAVGPHAGARRLQAHALLATDEAVARCRLWRLSRPSAGAGGVLLGVPTASARAERASWAAPIGSSPAGSKRSPPAFRRLAACRTRCAAKTHLTGNPVRPTVIAAAQHALSRRSPMASCGFSSPAARRARASCRTSCRRRSAAARRLRGKVSSSRSRRAPRTSHGCASA